MHTAQFLPHRYNEPTSCSWQQWTCLLLAAACPTLLAKYQKPSCKLSACLGMRLRVLLLEDESNSLNQYKINRTGIVAIVYLQFCVTKDYNTKRNLFLIIPKLGQKLHHSWTTWHRFYCQAKFLTTDMRGKAENSDYKNSHNSESFCTYSFAKNFSLMSVQILPDIN